MTQKQIDRIASLALLAGARPRDVVALLDNIQRWEQLGLVRSFQLSGESK